ncbi:hypothetical protein [Glycomyces tritici]|uniref:Uncharacterized protein n=1 Tax=Glycomyces tritici TaxID=2665176 RepID=A0ABT7YVE2_9ACTN|nr:hypothetical protein [Glycomyces tritici]MDN3242580.1 hypothetical protein [Glycomyces tritici]
MTSAFELRVLRYGAKHCGSFALADLKFTVHRDREHHLWVAVSAAGDPVLHPIGRIAGITAGFPEPSFERVAIGARVLFDPVWPLADLVFAQALQIGSTTS